MRMEFVCERAQTNEWVKVVLFVFFHCCLSSTKLTKLPLLFFVCLHRFFSLLQFKLFVSQHFFYSFIPYPWNLYRIDKSCFFATIRILHMDDPHTCSNLSTIQIYECDAATDKTKRISSISHFILFRTKLSGK